MEPTSNKTNNNEYENEKVPKSALKKWSHFLGMYAGEHAAGTEFVIGPLFLTTGVSAFDLLAGLLIGNFLAVLSWRFLTAEIAVSYRYTLYHHLEKNQIILPLLKNYRHHLYNQICLTFQILIFPDFLFECRMQM